MREKDLIKFVENVLNENLTHDNAHCYLEGSFPSGKHLKVTFTRDHKNLYSKLLKFVSENDGIIVSTCPATLSTVVRCEGSEIWVCARETWDKIEKVSTVEEGIKLIEKFEADDKADGSYEENYYDVISFLV